VATGNLNFTESPQGLFGLAGLLVQPLASNNQPAGPSLGIPPVLSVFLTLNFAHVTTVNRDASGNVVISVNLAGIAFNLDYNGAGQLTGATVLGFPIPTALI
jgi:YD repeat-containing protein